MILDDLKNFIIQNSLAKGKEIKYDYDASKGDEMILLHLYDSAPCNLARRSGVRITVKFNDLTEARETCFELHDLLFPEELFQKAVKNKGLERSFKQAIPQEVYDRLEKEMGEIAEG